MRFDESYLQGEYRDGFYVSSMVKRSFASQMEVLEVVDRICKSYGIKYFADWGTMLGTVRHHGFVPWDDDIDICMLRDDYEHFMEVAGEILPREFKLLNVQRTSEHRSLITRVVNSDSIRTGQEFLDRYHGCPYVVGIDIFPLDYVPRDAEASALQCTLVKLIHQTISSLDEENIEDTEIIDLIEQIQSVTGITLQDAGSNVVESLWKLLDGLCAMYGPKEADNVAIMLDYAMGWFQCVPKKYYEQAVEMPYEVTMMPVPVGYDALLRNKYGNYKDYQRGGSSHDYPYYRGQAKQLEEALNAGTVTIADKYCDMIKQSMCTIRKPVPVEKEGFVDIVRDDIYYLDKTGYIKEEVAAHSYLLTAPRRWGKSLLENAYLAYNTVIYEGEFNDLDCSEVFEGYIAGKDSRQEDMASKVVFWYTLKMMISDSFEETMALVKRDLRRNLNIFACLLQTGCLTEKEQSMLSYYVEHDIEDSEISHIIRTLVSCLYRRYQKPVCFVLDHYDECLQRAYLNGYYDKMEHFLKQIMEDVVDQNEMIGQFIINGEHLIGKDTIFEKFPELEVVSITDSVIDGYLGYTQDEVEEMFSFYGITDRLSEAKEWFGGYRYAEKELYNPWDVNNYVLAVCNGAQKPYPFWINATAGKFVNKVLSESADMIKPEIEKLLRGETVSVLPHCDISYDALYHNKDEIMNFLFQSGYLAKVSECDGVFQVRIPNREMRDFFATVVQ